MVVLITTFWPIRFEDSTTVSWDASKAGIRLMCAGFSFLPGLRRDRLFVFAPKFLRYWFWKALTQAYRKRFFSLESCLFSPPSFPVLTQRISLPYSSQRLLWKGEQSSRWCAFPQTLSTAACSSALYKPSGDIKKKNLNVRRQAWSGKVRRRKKVKHELKLYKTKRRLNTVWSIYLYSFVKDHKNEWIYKTSTAGKHRPFSHVRVNNIKIKA